jgi:glyoxylase-like metal-dependent hydrolase (beta-lactamase superfamily II)
MELHPVYIANFKVDGGVMFGVVPKTIWNKKYPADDNNLINLALRSLLIKTDDRNILIDTGWGDKQDDNFFEHVHLNGGDGLEGGLNKAGVSVTDITDVVLTHLHADHCGGTIRLTDDGKDYACVFPNATVWVSRDQWNWAIEPNIREKDAFLEENILPIQQTGKLRLVTENSEILPGFEVRLVNGHTVGQMVPVIHYKNKKIIFTADLIPTSAHLPLLFNMAYDLFQLDTIREKSEHLKEAYENNYILFFEHDVFYECCDLKQTDRGIRANRTFTLEEWLNGG